MSPLPDRTVLVRICGAPGVASADRTTAAAPSVNDEHISRVRGHTMDGRVEDLVDGDLGSGTGRCGLRAP